MAAVMPLLTRENAEIRCRSSTDVLGTPGHDRAQQTGWEDLGK